MLVGIFVGLSAFYGFAWYSDATRGYLSPTWEMIGLAMGGAAALYTFVIFKYGDVRSKISLGVFGGVIFVPYLIILDSGTREQILMVYSLSQVWVGVLVMGAVLALMLLQWAGHNPLYALSRLVAAQAFGSAKWASWWQLRREGMLEKGGLFLGRSRGADIYHNSEGHIFTVGGTGGGKSSGLVVPALLELTQGSVIVTDPSGELAAMTMRHRETIGEVVLLNPFGEVFRQGTGLDYPDTGFNPLSALDPQSSTFKAECDALARLLMVSDRRDSGSYWNDEGAALMALLIAATLLYESKEKHTLTHLFSLVRSRTDIIVETLEKIVKHNHPAYRDEAGGFIDIITDSPPQWQGMLRKAATATARYAPTTPLGDHVSKDGFDVADLKTKNVTVYILVPPSQLPTALPWMNLLIGVFAKAIGAPGQARKVTLLIDETPSLGFLPDLQFVMAQFRKVGLRVWLFTQTMSQMQAPELYGREGFEALFGLCTIKQFFALDEPEAQSKLSQLCGEKTARNISDNVGGRSIADVGVPLMRPEEARRLTKWRQVIIKGGMSDPIKGRLVPYFKREEWMKRIDPNPYRDSEIPPEEKKKYEKPSFEDWATGHVTKHDTYWRGSSLLSFLNFTPALLAAIMVFGGIFHLGSFTGLYGGIENFNLWDGFKLFWVCALIFVFINALDWLFFLRLPKKRRLEKLSFTPVSALLPKGDEGRKLLSPPYKKLPPPYNDGLPPPPKKLPPPNA